jgi:hypothetical protein
MHACRTSSVMMTARLGEYPCGLSTGATVLSAVYCPVARLYSSCKSHER